MDLITISYNEHPFGFARATPRTMSGVKFDNGKIAFLNEDGEIRSCESEAKLKEAFSDVVLTPFVPAAEQESEGA